jgi:hypothetical protein
MAHHFALSSIIFMMGFVMTFDNIHHRNRLNRLWSSITLLSVDEVDRLRAIWSACQDV